MVTISERLQQANSVFEFATHLGRDCLDRGGEMLAILADEDARREMERLELLVGRTDLGLWKTAIGVGNLKGLVPTDLEDQVKLLRADHPLEFLGVLRGLCRRALSQLYVETQGQLLLDRGSPVRFVARPVQLIFSAATPRQETLQNGQLLEGLGFSLFSHSAGGEVQVALDFSHRRRLDDLTWIEGDPPRLPRVATLHPHGDGEFTHKDLGANGFFDVGPKAWDVERVLTLLAEVADAEIALMPELSMPSPDALAVALGANPNSYPPLVVAGSAHQRLDETTWINESRVYLDGTEVARHRKIHPYLAAPPAGLGKKAREAISREPKRITLLSGSKTRLAVVICADLDDSRIPSLLTEAGANLLLVPSFTDDPGAFNGAICNLASSCQAVAVIANSQLGEGANQRFRVAAAVPRSAFGEQSKDYGPDPKQPHAEATVLDPNVRLSGALTWK